MLMTMSNHALSHPGDATELFTLLGMLEPITIKEAQARRAKFGGAPLLEGADEEVGWFKCRHWDETTRLCTIYDQRPWMCRIYPSTSKGEVCDHGCDCVGERIPRSPA
jgi:Fe-S-cluster containining protein